MPAVAKKVAPMSPTKSGEAKPAVGEKVAPKSPTKSEEASCRKESCSEVTS